MTVGVSNRVQAVCEICGFVCVWHRLENLMYWTKGLKMLRNR